MPQARRLQCQDLEDEPCQAPGSSQAKCPAGMIHHLGDRRQYLVRWLDQELNQVLPSPSLLAVSSGCLKVIQDMDIYCKSLFWPACFSLKRSTFKCDFSSSILQTKQNCTLWKETICWKLAQHLILGKRVETWCPFTETKTW